MTGGSSNDTNLLKSAWKIDALMDIACGMSAQIFQPVAVTAAVDNLFFITRSDWELVNLKHSSRSGRTSMEIMVKVFAENTLTGQIRLANELFHVCSRGSGR
jgi:acyl-CoA hydrolase